MGLSVEVAVTEVHLTCMVVARVDLIRVTAEA